MNFNIDNSDPTNRASPSPDLARKPSSASEPERKSSPTSVSAAGVSLRAQPETRRFMSPTATSVSITGRNAKKGNTTDDNGGIMSVIANSMARADESRSQFNQMMMMMMQQQQQAAAQKQEQNSIMMMAMMMKVMGAAAKGQDEEGDSNA